MANPAVPGAPAGLPVERGQALHLLRKMWEIRFFEQAAGRLYQKGLVRGGVHPCIGQEAVAVGVCACLRADDLIASNHRGHGHHIAKGADLGRLMAEVLGKATGYCGGRGGSMHVAAFDVGSLGAFPILASGVPVAVGAALSARLQGRDRVVAAFFGEGALAQGTLHEAANMAAVWQLPVLFVCENNQYAVSTPMSQTIAFRDLTALAAAYGMPAEEVDGQDVLAVMAATRRLVERGGGGGGPGQQRGPGLLHARTCRFEGHYFGEPQVYRSREEVAQARQRLDPIARFRDTLLAQGWLDETGAQAIQEAAGEAVEAALAFAQASPDPDPEEVAAYVYVA